MHGLILPRTSSKLNHQLHRQGNIFSNSNITTMITHITIIYWIYLSKPPPPQMKSPLVDTDRDHLDGGDRVVVAGWNLGDLLANVISLNHLPESWLQFPRTDEIRIAEVSWQYQLIFLPFKRILSNVPCQRQGGPMENSCRTNPKRRCGWHWGRTGSLRVMKYHHATITKTIKEKTMSVCQIFISERTGSSGRQPKRGTAAIWKTVRTSRLGTSRVSHGQGTLIIGNSLMFLSSFIRNTPFSVALVGFSITSLKGRAGLGSTGSSTGTVGILGMGTPELIHETRNHTMKVLWWMKKSWGNRKRTGCVWAKKDQRAPPMRTVNDSTIFVQNAAQPK